jgi:hypothetical protein
MTATLVYERPREIESPEALSEAKRVLGGIGIQTFAMRGKRTLVVTVDPAEGRGFTRRLEQALGANPDFWTYFDEVDFS